MRIPIGLLFLFLYLCLPFLLLAQNAKLVAEGKKDGKVVIYGSMATDIFDGIHPALADADKIQVVEMDEPDANMMAEKRKEYRKIFQ